MFNLIKKSNSTQPYGWNDDGMIKAKGSQTMTRWGAYTRFGPLSIQYMPEDIKAENLPYEIGEDYGIITTNKYQKTTNILAQKHIIILLQHKSK